MNKKQIGEGEIAAANKLSKEFEDKPIGMVIDSLLTEVNRLRMENEQLKQSHSPSKKEQEVLKYIWQLNANQKLATLGFLMARLYNDANFIRAFDAAIVAFMDDPNLTDRVETKH